MLIIADGLDRDGKIKSIATESREELLSWMESNGIGWITIYRYHRDEESNLLWITRDRIKRWIDTGIL